MKAICIAAAAAAVSPAALAVEAGALAFTSFNADEDGWSIVALTDLQPGLSVYFSERTWDAAAGAFVGSEASYQWLVDGGGVEAGSVVRFASVNNAARRASAGSLSASGVANLSATGETLFAYIGATPDVPDSFIAALSTEDFAGGQLDGTGLALGVSALSLASGADYAEYVGPRSGLAAFADYAELLNDAANWTIETSGDMSGRQPSLAAFDVTAPVPEPSTYAMLLAGLGFVSYSVRRRLSD
ncbi:MAG: PEP-CTERM sorting domain-containing protein [Zoogloeaceae bacterium]|nr:PEP-CTERM sorting domain-containing protein [Rhodocyclaceae bacterium]MCP5238133.1 PEP-CTERM sorting domain-containing protein [Zoogloeaceae bacterium]